MAFSFLFKNSVKLGLVGGAVYVSVEKGVWGSCEQSKAAYDKLLNILPGSKEFTDKLKININPTQDYLQKPVREHWNNGVIWVFSNLIVLPHTATKYSKIAWSKISETIK